LRPPEVFQRRASASSPHRLLHSTSRTLALSIAASATLLERPHRRPCCTRLPHENASGAAVDSRNNNAMTALMVAAKYGQVGAVRVLLEAGAEIGCKGENG